MDHDEIREKLQELSDILQNEMNRLQIKNLDASFSILESMERHLEANPDNLELAKMVAELRGMADEVIEELTEEQLNAILDEHTRNLEEWEKKQKSI